MIIFIISLYFPKPMYTTKHTATYLYLETFVFSVGFFFEGGSGYVFSVYL